VPTPRVGGLNYSLQNAAAEKHKKLVDLRKKAIGCLERIELVISFDFLYIITHLVDGERTYYSARKRKTSRVENHVHPY